MATTLPCVLKFSEKKSRALIGRIPGSKNYTQADYLHLIVHESVSSVHRTTSSISFPLMDGVFSKMQCCFTNVPRESPGRYNGRGYSFVGHNPLSTDAPNWDYDLFLSIPNADFEAPMAMRPWLSISSPRFEKALFTARTSEGLIRSPGEWNQNIPGADVTTHARRRALDVQTTWTDPWLGA